MYLWQLILGIIYIIWTIDSIRWMLSKDKFIISEIDDDDDYGIEAELFPILWIAFTGISIIVFMLYRIITYIPWTLKII